MGIGAIKMHYINISLLLLLLLYNYIHTHTITATTSLAELSSQNSLFFVCLFVCLFVVVVVFGEIETLRIVLLSIIKLVLFRIDRNLIL